jgi:hypothetical protein
MRKTLTNLAQTAVDVVRAALSPRDTIAAQLAELRARHATEGAEEKRALDAAQAEVDALDEPRRRLERLKQTAFAAGLRREREVAALERRLREDQPRALLAFEHRLDRLFGVLRERLVVEEETNNLTGVTRVANLDAIERRRTMAALVARHRLALAHELWRLPSEALHERLTALHAELETAAAGDPALEAALA